MSLSEGSAALSQAVSSRHREGYDAIASKLPPWLLKTTAKQRQFMRQQGKAAIPWVSSALLDTPAMADRLQSDYQAHAGLDAQVDAWLAELADPQRFAEPLLKAALLERFGLEVDVRNTWLLNPRRMQVDDSFLAASRDWMVESFKAFRLACRPLLDVALQNFEAWECEPGGMDLAVTKAQIVAVVPGQPLWQGTTLNIAPERFAALCRELDLGRRYQERIAQTFEPGGVDGQDDAVALRERQQVFRRHEQSGLLLHLHLAHLQARVGKALYQAVLERINGRQATLDGVAFTCGCLTLWNVELRGIVVFGADRTVREGTDRIVVYIPGDPVEPLREHASFIDFCAHLRDRLWQADYLAFFQRFMPLRQRAGLLEKLHQAFHPKVWNLGGWYETVEDRQASLAFHEVALVGSLPAVLLQRKIAGFKDDGLFVAVPTAAEDHKSLVEKLDYFAQAGLVVLNGLAFAVPVVGAAMLVFSVAQLAHEVYEGIGEWTRDAHEQAWNYLLDVIENLALMVALGQAGAPGRELPALPDALHPVRLADGGTRLWSRDLVPFAHDVVLPADLQPDPRGLYHYQGKQWLVLDGRCHALVEPGQGAAYLQHPRRPDAYRPTVRHQAGGIWLHELDRPREWSGLELFQRLGAMKQRLDSRDARHLLVISGCHESELRRALVDGQRPPALLLDSLERLRMYRSLEGAEEPLSREHHARLFDMLYQAPGQPAGPAAQVLVRDFSGLPRRVVDELLEHATQAERGSLEGPQRVPQRLAEEARLYLQGVRLARAYEGLYLQALGNNDSTRLILHSLEALPGWAEQLRVEIRALRSNGPLLDSIGPRQAVHRRVLVKSADGYRTAEEPHVAAADLFAVVWRILTSVQREALGLSPRTTSDGLRRKVMERPLERPGLRKVLHMQPIRPAMRSPMRLASGRPGYPLSGRARLAPLLSENTLLDKIRLLELPDVFAADLLQQLRNIRLSNAAIDARLDALLDEHGQLQRLLPLDEASRPLADGEAPLTDRQLIELALWQHWRDNLLPEVGRCGVPLRLFAVSLDSFPEHLPDFFCQRVQALELSGVSVPAATLLPGEAGPSRLDDPLSRLLRGFPRVTTLEIDGLEGRAPHELPRIVVGAYPRLAELRLLNVHLPLGQEVLDELGRLAELRHLDLSGNRLGHLPIRLTEPLQLEFLGLDRLGLESWPLWLDSEALDCIDELSLRDNRLTELPAHVRNNPLAATRVTRILLNGNLFSQQALIRLRMEAWQGRRFRFELRLPRTVENIVEGMLLEQRTLSASIKTWLESSHHNSGLGEARVAARRALGDVLLASWTAQANGSTSRSLVLEDLHLEDFPDVLPAFFYSRISRLELIRPVGSLAQLDTLVGYFNRLEQLSVSAIPLVRLPDSLARLAELRSLALVDAHLMVDQGMLDALGRMSGLTALDLSGNRLGDISDMSLFSRLSLNLLGLERMAIDQWPAWLDGMLPERIQWLNLNHNQLTTLPAYLLDNAESASGSTEISLEGNPLTEETLHSAHLSEGFSRPYTFRVDLPEHLRRLDAGDSWRGSSSGADSSRGTSEGELINVDIWLDKSGSLNDQRRQLWRQLETSGDADDLLHLVGRLRHTAEYRSNQTRPELIERVWQVLTSSAQDIELCLLLNGMAAEPLRQLREFDTCPDGIRLEFNQMEVLVFTRQALRSASDAQRGPVLYRLMRRLYRLQELDNIARRETGDRDEAEVRLAYRLGLSNELDLPLAPEQMLYAGSANLRAGELERAASDVREGESGQGLMNYAIQRDFWLTYLQEVHAERFRAIREAFEARVLGLVDLYPGDTPVQASERIQALIDQRKQDEANLVRELTYREGQQPGSA